MILFPEMLIHPMTAGDLVQSSQLVSWVAFRGGLEPQIRIFEVVRVERDEGDVFLRLEVMDLQDGMTSFLQMKPETPILVTGISM